MEDVMTDRPANLPEGVTWEERSAKHYLARYGKAGEYRKYCTTLEEAVEWLNTNKPKVSSSIRALRPQLSNYNRQLDSVAAKIIEIANSINQCAEISRGESKYAIMERMENIQNSAESVKEAIELLHSAIEHITNT
jgi:methyl-accepting chemotaxis protein